MDTNTPRDQAERLLEKLIENQSNLFAVQALSTNNGAPLADFCANFIETYAKYLTNREKSGG